MTVGGHWTVFLGGPGVFARDYLSLSHAHARLPETVLILVKAPLRSQLPSQALCSLGIRSRILGRGARGLKDPEA